MLINITVEILLQDLVYLLHLTIRLWVIKGGKTELDLQQAHKLPQELGSKLGPFIHHHAIRQTMAVKQ